MKKLLCTLTVFGFLFAACEGPIGPQGVVGPVGSPGVPGPTGPAGKDGTNGTNGKDGINGKDGTSASARYYDYELSWIGTTPSSTTDFRIPNWNYNKEFAITYVFSGSLINPIGYVAAEDLESKVTNIVDLKATYTVVSTGLMFISDYRYKENGLSRYKFRTVVAPMVAGGRLSANTPYAVIKQKYNLPD